MHSYLEFLANKQKSARPAGFEIDPAALHPLLFDWQKLAVQWALSLGRAALFEERGLGKTIQQIEWARQVHLHTHRPVLIVCPLAVARQTIREGEKIDAGITYVRSMDEVKKADTPLFIINYDMLDQLDPAYFGGLVLDECFAPDTLIDCPTSDGWGVCQIPINQLKEGDLIINASGVDIVSDIHRREVPYAVKVTINGKIIISSPNHPFFTQRGWVGAQDLEPGDYALETTQAMRLVWERVQSEIHWPENAAFLRDILLSEMANESTGDFSENPQSRGFGKTRSEEICLVQDPGSTERITTHSGVEPDGITGSERKSLPRIENDKPQTFRVWGQWERLNQATRGDAEIAWSGMDSGISLIVGQTNSRLSNTLQARLGESRAKSLYRGGWSLPSLPETTGSEERRKTGLVRVDGIEILELGHCELDKYRDADGKLYFYDIGATQHPSFSVNGILVHNSSILKAYTGKTKQFILERFVPSIPYRLFCTATPAPNDTMELGNHAEGLGVMDSSQMLANWFQSNAGDVKSGEIVAGKYAIKPYAERDFWRWVTTWACIVSTPSDLGYSDEGYIRLPLDIRSHLIGVDHSRAHSTTDQKGQHHLFLGNELSATSMWAEKAKTFKERCYKGIELTEAEPGEYHIVWCDTNEESAMLTKELTALYRSDIVEVKGSDPLSEKEAKLDAFSTGQARIIVTKSKIAGMGLNWQHCARHKFVSLNFKWEEWYQAVGRTDRFGNPRQTVCDIILTETEQRILAAWERKGRQHQGMHQKVREIIKEFGLWRKDKRSLNFDLGNQRMELPQWLKAA